MTSYKELYLRSQAIIADAIDNLEIISGELKRCMQECEDKVISKENKIIQINEKKICNYKFFLCTINEHFKKMKKSRKIVNQRDAGSKRVS